MKDYNEDIVKFFVENFEMNTLPKIYALAKTRDARVVLHDAWIAAYERNAPKK